MKWELQKPKQAQKVYHSILRDGTGRTLLEKKHMVYIIQVYCFIIYIDINGNGHDVMCIQNEFNGGLLNFLLKQ